ncbi:pyruvate ferredoxin oxidoreductase, partial [Candidatus Woesearchaeota archaeon]|nr:pyruvate ferredoxin oxidoreductase [Candidatus Woesearchaeota archaeon]
MAKKVVEQNSKTKVIEASMAVAIAAKLCKPDVVAVYPITPQTHIPERIADFVYDGESDIDLIDVESEHSALSACIGAQAAGSRTFTATASQGLALMHEVLFVASGLRLPIVMAVVNRTLSAPINIWCDHQ